MTVKLVVLYTHPDDTDAFDRHYAGVHMPLVDKIPGLLRTETGEVRTALDGGEKTYYRITELYFADQAALQAGFGSDEATPTAADYKRIAAPGPRMSLGPVEE